MNSKKQKTQAKVTDDEDAMAAQKLAEAFSLIEEYSDYLPTDVHRQIADGVADFVGRVQWKSDPQLCRRIMPLLVAKAIEEEDGE